MRLIELTHFLEACAMQQPAVNMIVRDDVRKLNDNPADRYAAFVWTQGQHSGSLDNDFRTYRFTLFYVDRLLHDKSNTTEVQSVAMDVLENIVRMVADVLEVESWTYDTFTQRFTDECAGAYVSINISAPGAFVCPTDYAAGEWESDGEYIVRK